MLEEDSIATIKVYKSTTRIMPILSGQRWVPFASSLGDTSLLFKTTSFGGFFFGQSVTLKFARVKLNTSGSQAHIKTP